MEPTNRLNRAAEPAGERLRVGIVGTGYWARWCHGAVLAERDDIEFVGFYGRSLEHATIAADEVGGQAFDDLDDLLGRVDALSFAVSPDAQPQIAVRAAAAGKHLLLDKPLALDRKGAEQVVRGAEEGGVTVLSFMTLLFQERVRNWLKDLEPLSDQRGPWEGASFTFTGSIDTPDNPYAQSVWRRERGGLWDLGPHALSLIGAILPRVETIGAVRGPQNTVTATTTHSGGQTAFFTVSIDALPGTEVAQAEVWGPGGRHRLDLPTSTLREAYGSAVDAWVELIGGQPGPDLGAEYGLNLVRVLEAAEESITEERRVRLSG